MLDLIAVNLFLFLIVLIMLIAIWTCVKYLYTQIFYFKTVMKEARELQITKYKLSIEKIKTENAIRTGIINKLREGI